MKNMTKNLLVLGFALLTLPAASYARAHGDVGGREGRESDLQDRSYGRDRSYGHDYDGHHDYNNHYNHYDGRGYYQGYPVYYNGGYNGGVEFIPAPDAESYNDITNPQPTDQSNASNFQNSNFDNQIWDMNN